MQEEKRTKGEIIPFPVDEPDGDCVGEGTDGEKWFAQLAFYKDPEGGPRFGFVFWARSDEDAQEHIEQMKATLEHGGQILAFGDY